MTGQSKIPAEILNNRYWRAADATTVLEFWRASGVPLAHFAREQGVGLGRLQRWKQRLCFERRPTAAPDGGGSVRFAPVRLVTPPTPSPTPPPATSSSRWFAEVELVNGRKVRIGSDVRASELRALLDVLEC